MSDLTIIN